MTQRQYAAHRGVSQPAVAKAIKNGRIRLGPDGKIDPEQADRDWKSNTDPEKQANGRTGGSKKVAATPPSAQPRAPTASTSPEPVAPAAMDYNKARAAKEILAAKLLDLEFKERTGELVPRDAVKIGIFKALTILKGSVMGIHSAARLQTEIPQRTVELIDKLCRDALAEAHKSLMDLADGNL